MNTKDLTLLSIGAGIVLTAYLMKKGIHEGFQGLLDPQPPMGQPPQPPMGQQPQPPMGQPPQPPMGQQPQPPMGQPPQPPMGQPPQPPMGQPPQPPMGQPPQPPQPPMGQPQPPQPPMGQQPQPQPMGMQPNQQQLMDIAAKVQRAATEQTAISSQLQQMTQSFGKEGFQSYQNPYNAASPGDTQATEFRLGKKSLIDNVVRY